MTNSSIRKILLPILTSGIIVQSFYNCGRKAETVKSINRTEAINLDTPYAISGVINDPDDPVSLRGIDFVIGDSMFSGENVFITASSSNSNVVADSNLILSGSRPIWNLRIKATTIGYSTISVAVEKGTYRRSYTIYYAASQTTPFPSKRWHTGLPDASAAISVDNTYMIVANDETNVLYLFNKNHSGQPIRSFDFNQMNILGLTDSSGGKWKEVDVEGGVRSINHPNLIYWIGSMSNNSSYFTKPNRNRLFAITISGKGAATQISNAGHYSRLREKLIAWGDAHGYDFLRSAAVGKNPKLVDGFNIEGMVFAPDNSTMYIGFRAPLVPIGRRTKAVIAPIENFENWFNNGAAHDNPAIGDPIELDLAGRGIRDVIQLPNGKYVIIAGSSDIELRPAVYSWTGHPTDVPVEINSFTVAGLNVEAVLPVYDAGRFSLNKLQVLTDNGNDILYGDTVIVKNIPEYNFKKFSSIIIESPHKEVLGPTPVTLFFAPRWPSGKL